MFSTILKDGIMKGEFRKDLDIEICMNFFLKSVFAIVHPYVFETERDLSKFEIEMDFELDGSVLLCIEEINKKEDENE